MNAWSRVTGTGRPPGSDLATQSPNHSGLHQALCSQACVEKKRSAALVLPGCGKHDAQPTSDFAYRDALNLLEGTARVRGWSCTRRADTATEEAERAEGVFGALVLVMLVPVEARARAHRPEVVSVRLQPIKNPKP